MELFTGNKVFHEIFIIFLALLLTVEILRSM